jgi:hypothetical protein
MAVASWRATCPPGWAAARALALGGAIGWSLHQAKIKVSKPPKPPRAIQDAQWLLGCFTEASMEQG